MKTRLSSTRGGGRSDPGLIGPTHHASLWHIAWLLPALLIGVAAFGPGPAGPPTPSQVDTCCDVADAAACDPERISLAPAAAPAQAGAGFAGGSWLFDTTGFPPRWNCGAWPVFLGWLHIISDVAIWGAYMAIPIVLAFFVLKKRTPLPHITWLFIAFIASCGIGHLIEAMIFWAPVYRLAGVWKAVTATVSWMTVAALIPVVPKVLGWPSLQTVNQRLRVEVKRRRENENRLRELNGEIVSANQRHAATVHELELQKSALDEHAIVAITDTRGVITYVNDKFCEISGYDRDELIGQTHRIVNSGHHPKSFFIDMWRTIAHGETWHGEICNRTKGGDEYWVDTTIVPFKDKRGGITQYVAIRADITDRKQIERQVREHAAELQSSNRQLEEFVYTVSHDLKSPIVTIQGYAGFAKKDLSKGRSDRLDQFIDRIDEGSNNMRGIIDDLLELSRVGRVLSEPEPVDPGEIATEVADNMRPQLDERGATVTIEPDMPRVLANPVRIGQVFQNLIHNALMHGAPDDGAPVIHVGGSLDGDEALLFVRDNGPGVPEEYHQKIFGLFQRLDNRSEGTGVGLAIVRRVAETHGGRAWVESPPDGGACFCVALPAAAPVPADHRSEPVHAG